MTVQIAQLFEPAVLGTSAGAIYTMAGSPTTLTLAQGRVRFTNTSGSAVAVTAYAVPSSGSPAAGNCFLSAQSIAAGQYLDIDLPVLKAGDSFQAFAGAATSITCSELNGVLFS